MRSTSLKSTSHHVNPFTVKVKVNSYSQRCWGYLATCKLLGWDSHLLLFLTSICDELSETVTNIAGESQPPKIHEKPFVAKGNAPLA